MRLHRSLLTAAVLAMALAGCTSSPGSGTRVYGKNPGVPVSSDPVFSGWGGAGWGNDRPR
jgi:hypothetical protein